MTTALVAIACRRATPTTQPSTTVVVLMACIGKKRKSTDIHYVSNGYGDRAMMWMA
jgi:hypothetical protein